MSAPMIPVGTHVRDDHGELYVFEGEHPGGRGCFEMVARIASNGLIGVRADASRLIPDDAAPDDARLVELKKDPRLSVVKVLDKAQRPSYTGPWHLTFPDPESVGLVAGHAGFWFRTKRDALTCGAWHLAISDYWKGQATS